MSPFRVDRRRRDPDQFLGQKMFIFVAGAILAIAGMATDRPWMIYAAAAVLSVGVLLRFFGRSRGAAADEHDDMDSPGTFDDDVMRDDVMRDDVTRNDVVRDDVTRDNVNRDDVTRDDVTQEDVRRHDEPRQ